MDTPLSNALDAAHAPVKPFAKAHAPRYRPDIDGLRAVAVLLVLGYHAFPNVFPGGFIGVDIFFVISGFLITDILFREAEQGPISFLGFYSRRIRRIFPALIVVATAAFCIGWFVLPPNELRSLGASLSGGAFFVQNLVLLREVGYFDIVAARKPLLHLWSLGIEEQFYIFWPVLIVAIARLRINPVAAIFVLSLASFAYGIATLKVNGNLAFYSPLSRAWEFGLGSMLAIARAGTTEGGFPERPKRNGQSVFLRSTWIRNGFFRRLPLQDLSAIAGVAIVCYCLVALNSRTPYPGITALAPVVASILLIASGDAWVNRRLLSGRAMVFVGLISYPLYLWHYPLIAFMRIHLADEIPMAFMLICVSLSVMLAWLTYRIVENPIRRSTGIAHRLISVPWLLIAMGTVGLLGMAAIATSGFSGREPDHLKRFMLTEGGTTVHWRSGSCFLSPTQSADEFESACSGGGRRPLIFLWGDSHGAALYPGLQSVSDSNHITVAQYTTAGCPPLLGYTNPRRAGCREINAFVARKVRELRPQIVVLHSMWNVGEEDLDRGLRATIQEIRKMGEGKIVLVGPVPTWKGNGLSANVLDYYYGEGAFALLPARTKYRLIETDADGVTRRLSRRLDIPYFSPWDVMCNKEGCLARVGKEGADLTAFDNGHLTLAGSNLVAQSLWLAMR